MIFIILAGSSRHLFLNFFFFWLSPLSLSHTQRKASFLSLSSFFLVDRIVYQHVLYFCIVWLRCILLLIFRVCPSFLSKSRRLLPLFFLRFASASLYNSYSHSYCYSSQARRASSVAYLYYQVDHSIYNV